MSCSTAAVCALWLGAAATGIASPTVTSRPESTALSSQTTTPAAPPATGERLTLQAAIVEARAASPGRRAAVGRAQAAASSAHWAGQLQNPSVDVRVENWQPGGRAATDPSNDAFVVLTQPFALGGKAGARRRVAETDAAGRAIDVQVADRQLALEVAHYFMGAVRARGRLAVLASQGESTREVVTILSRRVAEGVTPEADLRKVETDLARLELDVTRGQIDLQSNLAWLGALLGRAAPPAEDDLVAPDVGPLDARLATDGQLTAVPEVAAARQRVALAAASYDLTRRERWPDLLVSGGYKRTAGVNTAVAGVAVSLPVFNQRDREVALGLAERAAAAQEAQDMERRARAEALARLTEARLLADRAARVEQDVLVPAEIAWRAARASLREGAGDVLRLLDAERVYGDARREANDLKLEAALAHARARLALGEDVQ